MFKTLVRTTAFFGTLFAAGYVAKRYFGWNPQGLLVDIQDKVHANSKGLKSPLRDAADQRAI